MLVQMGVEVLLALELPCELLGMDLPQCALLGLCDLLRFHDNVFWIFDKTRRLYFIIGLIVTSSSGIVRETEFCYMSRHVVSIDGHLCQPAGVKSSLIASQ